MIKSAVILVLCAAPVFAQTGRPAALGDRVRVMASKAGYRRLTGQVIATTPDVLQLRLDGGKTEVAVQRAQIDELLLSLASRRNTMRGAAIGGLVGGAGAFLYGPRKKTSVDDPGTRSPINTITGIVGGAAIGALFGYYTRSDQWIALSPRP
jgi:hypothetical protein